jgi:hypothetical protein
VRVYYDDGSGGRRGDGGAPRHRSTPAAQRDDGDATATERATERPIHTAKFFSGREPHQVFGARHFRDAARGSAMSEFLAATSQRPERAKTVVTASPRSVRPTLSPRGWSARMTRSTTRSTRRFSLTNRSRRSGVVREEDCDAFLDMLRLPVGQACFARFARTDETWNRHSARSLLLCWLDVQELKTIPPNSDFRIHKGLDLIKKYVSKGAPRRWRRRRGGARGCARAGRGEEGEGRCA